MSLKKQTLWSMLPLLSVTVVNLASVRLFFRYLGPEMYALWGYVATFSGSFGFMDLGLGVAVGRYIGIALGRGDRAAVRQYWGTGNATVLPLLAAMSVIFSLIGTIFGPIWFNVSPEHAASLRWCFLIGGAGLFLSYYGQFWLILSQANLDFKFLAVLRTGVSLVTVIPSVALAAIFRNPVALVAWACLMGFAQLGIYVYHGRASYRLGLELQHASWSRAREMAAYTGKNFAQLIVASLLGSLDRLLVGRVAPAVAFAQYSVSVNAGNRVVGVSNSVLGPIYHNSNRGLAADAPGSAAALYDEAFNFILPWFLLACAGAALWSPVLCRMWLGSSLGAQVAPVFPILLLGCCLSALANISNAQLSSHNRLGTCLLFQIASGVLLAIGVVAGWRLGGLIGVAWGFVFSRLAFISQDLFAARLFGAGGWRASSTWVQIALQGVVALAFLPARLFVRADSYWLFLPAALHGGLMAAWILRGRLGKLFGHISALQASRPSSAAELKV